MRSTAFAVSAGALALILGGCGYVGPVVPPSPQIPQAITDLAVSEVGSELQISFTTPARTTDNLAIDHFSEVELNIGPEVRPFDIAQWAGGAKQYSIPVPPATEKGIAQPARISYTVSAADWVGKDVAMGVRTAVKRNKGDFSAWSNFEHMTVIAPLKPPVITVTPTAQGYRLTWNAEGPGMRYEIFRQGPGETASVQIGISEKPEYVDGTAKWDTPYTYSVAALRGTAQSLASNQETVNQHDIYPPSVPSGLTGLATANSIELSWQRSPESDLKGYYIYRSVNGGPITREGGLVALPTLSDRAVQHGATYRYEVSAIDQNNNESAKSPAVTVAFP